MTMYELVVQFRGREVETEEEIVEIEDVMFELLADGETIDGHEVGAQARNISLMTGRPRDTFARLQPFLAQAALIDHVIAAFRSPNEHAYTVIWPTTVAGFSRT
jgi:hypothetical protein